MKLCLKETIKKINLLESEVIVELYYVDIVFVDGMIVCVFLYFIRSVWTMRKMLIFNIMDIINLFLVHGSPSQPYRLQTKKTISQNLPSQSNLLLDQTPSKHLQE